MNNNKLILILITISTLIVILILVLFFVIKLNSNVVTSQNSQLNNTNSNPELEIKEGLFIKKDSNEGSNKYAATLKSVSKNSDSVEGIVTVNNKDQKIIFHKNNSLFTIETLSTKEINSGSTSELPTIDLESQDEIYTNINNYVGKIVVLNIYDQISDEDKKIEWLKPLVQCNSNFSSVLSKNSNTKLDCVPFVWQISVTK